MKKVFIALMAYSGQIAPPVKNMLAEFEAEWRARGGKVMKSDSVGNCRITLARNAMVADFMASDADQLLFVDCDNYCEAVTLVRLAECPLDVVGLAIRTREENVRWNVRWLLDRPSLIATDPVTRQPSNTGFLEVEKVGTGIMKISRACLERMYEAYPENWYHDLANRTGRALALFEEVRRDNLYWSEDLIFCERWRAIGGEVWIDPTATTWHIGHTLFQGNIGNWTRHRGDTTEMERLFDVVLGPMPAK